jgi:predicted transport protein
MEPQKKQITLYLKLNPKSVVNPPSILRDVSNIGHYGTGDTELTIRSSADFEFAKELIKLAYRNVGG